MAHPIGPLSGPMTANSSLPTRAKAGYGAAELGLSAVELVVQVILLKLYTEVVGLDVGLAGLVLAAAVVWDAAIDPLVGTLSDRSTLPGGRRRSFMALGAPLLAVSTVVLLSPPSLPGSLAGALYLLAGSLLLNTAMTVIAVPHTAFAGELVPDSDGRNELFAWRFLWANVGLVAALVVLGLASGTSDEGLPHYGGASLALGGLVVASTALTLAATRRRDRPGDPTAGSVVELPRAVLSTLRNPPFVILLSAFVIGSVGRTVNASVALFYYQHRLDLDERQVFLHVLLPFTLVIALSIGAWLRLARWLGRKVAASGGILLLGLATSVAYPLFPPGKVAFPLGAAIVGGLLVGAVFLLDATVADLVDSDRLHTGRHREGLYFGVWRTAAKLARALGLLASGLMLDAIGFAPREAVQPPGVDLRLALVFGPGVGAFFLVAALLYLAMPFDEARARTVRALLAREAQPNSPNGRYLGVRPNTSYKPEEPAARV